MEERLLDYDPMDGIRTYFSLGEKGEWRIRTEFDDVSPSLDYSRGLANQPQHWKHGVKKEFAHYAHIPNSLLFKWHTEGVNINDPKALVEMCNRREYSYLKTTDKVHIAKA